MLRLPQEVRTLIPNFAEKADNDLMKLADSLRGTSRLSAPSAAAAAHEPELMDEYDDFAMAAQQRRPRSSNQRPVPDASRRSLCHFHKKFGRDARNCRYPCSYYSKNM